MKRKITQIKKFSTWLLLVLVSSVLYYLISVALLSNYHEKQEAYFNAEMNAFESKIRATLTTYEAFSNYLFEENFNTASVTQLMSLANQSDEQTQQALRTQLYNTFAKEYEVFTSYNFRQLHFHLANGESFLRFHRPELFGDNLTGFRDSIRLVGQNKEYVFGFEEGRIYNGYRFVYPLFYEDDYVGSVEVSISMATLSVLFRELYPHINTTFVIAEDVVKRLVFEDELSNYTMHPYLKGFFLDVEVQAAVETSCLTKVDPCYVFEELLRSEPDLLDRREYVSRILSYQGKDYLVLFLPIKNITGQAVAYYIGITEDETYPSLNDAVVREIIFVGLLFVLLLGTTYIYQRKQHELEILSSTDKLTNLPNRRHMIELAKREVLRFERYKTPVSVIMTDIDLFKRINDTYGHRVGDEVLLKFGNILKEVVRNLDVIARWGGEEFLLLLVTTGQDEAVEVAERLRQAIEQTDFSVHEKITASFGVATLREDESLDDFIDRSDRALYQAKAEGRNTVRLSNNYYNQSK
jgi:diguanylate cyclase (GGDEF)-like protein